MKALLAALALTLVVLPAHSAELTIERLFAAPDLAGDSLRKPRLSPDGRLAAYLKGAADNRDRMDLWAYDIGSKSHRQLIDARALAPEIPLSAEEAARRERQRTASLSGILDYQFSPDSRYILVPLAGDLYLYDLAAAPGTAVRRLTDTPAYETDAQFSPGGRYVGFIRDQNLVVLELATGRETAITTAGGGTVSYGMAEFVAQEEMDRDTGYWWSRDDRLIAYARVDEAGVAESERFEIGARGVEIVKQRYPYTGAANAKVDLYVAPIATPGAAVRMDLGQDADIYLARVDFLPGEEAVLAQRQSRDQRRLDLLRLEAATGAATTLLTETSHSWVPLHDGLKFLPDRRQFTWSSRRSGFEHLYLYDYRGKLLRQLTAGDYNVSASGIDEQRGWLYYSSGAGNPREKQLFRVPLGGPGQAQQLTSGPGLHSVTLSEDASTFLDNYSSTGIPPQLRLHAADGGLLETLVANPLAAGHPYFEFAGEHALAEFGTLRASDGQVLHYSLIKPPGMQPGKRYPVVVDVYGGPGAQRVTNSWAVGFNQLLARRGYVVFQLDGRGSGGRGERFEAASHLRLASVEVEDQKAGVAFLRTLPFVDGERIAISGWSYGGYMALMCILRAPDAFAAAISGAPVTDWRLYDTHYTERYMSTPQANPEGYRVADVATYARDLRRPLLLVHGMADDNVLFTHSTAVMRIFQENALPFELMTYPGGKHGLLRQKEMGIHGYHAMLEFLDRQLKR